MITHLVKPGAPHLTSRDFGAGAQTPARLLPVRKLPVSLLIFLLVLTTHAAGIFFMVWASAPIPQTRELVSPTIQGILINSPTAESLQPAIVQEMPPPIANPEPLKPQPKPLPKPKKTKPAPKPMPVVEASPSDKAISQEEVVQPEVAPSPAASATEQLDAENSLVTPPREDANHLSNPKPGYPSLSRRLREQGTVILEVFILSDGSVGKVRVKQSSGFKRLDDTAIKAVKLWKYTPARRGNEPIDFWYLQPLEFSLN